MIFYTVGVYGSTESDFFKKITDNGIDTFFDIRQRRGVRGAKYAFVNSQRLQGRLNELGINYGHVLELAPTTDIREFQKLADIQKGEQKRDRQVLGKIFSIEYKNRILNNFDFNSFIERLENVAASKIVLFCVEEKPLACHRSLVSDRLEQLGYKTIHL
jgi:uncharacterized protein (DUF488 family)